MKYFPITRHRAMLDQEYIQHEVDGGAIGYDSFEEADKALDWMNTDDSDYEVCVYDGSCWRAVRDGVIITRLL